MMKLLIQSALPALAILSTAYAQTWTSCNPLNSTCPPDTALGVSNYTIDFTTSMMSSRVWNATAGSVSYGTDGAHFTVAKKGDAPTVQSNFYIMFGQVEVIMKAAPGTGIVSSIVMESDDLDEVDWELIGGNNSYVQTNYFGKGNTTTYDRAFWYPVDDAQGQFHNYTTDWSAEKLDWYIDGQIVRTLNYGDANGGKNFPQTPCNVRLGIWAGGDSANNKYTIEWAGGVTNYDNGPYTMSIKSVRVADAGTGTQYTYGDHSGSYQSIVSSNSTSPLKLDGSSGGSSQTAVQKWHSLSTGAKIAIAAGVGGVVLLACVVFGFCCMKQRRQGKHERLVEDARFEQERAELMTYRQDMARSRSEKMMMQQQQMPIPMQQQPYGMAQSPMMSPQMHPQIPVQRQMTPMGGQSMYSPLGGGYRDPSVASSNGGYAQSAGSSVSGRGYQRY